MPDTVSPLAFVQAPAAPETFNTLLWGQPKSGKSTAAATAPGPILWVNAEGPGALGFARKTAVARGTAIHEVTIDRRTPDVSGVLDNVYLHIREGRDPQVRTVVVDTLAKVRDALVSQLVDPGSKNSLKQYGKVAEKLGGFVNALRDLPVNVVLLAHADVNNDAEDGRITLPLIGGKLTETIPGEVDVVAYCSPAREDDGSIHYYGQLIEGKGRTGLGDRSGAIADERGIRELDLSNWLALYRLGLTPDESDLPFGLLTEEEAVAEAEEMVRLADEARADAA
jgi:hypothetical protein